MINNEDVYWRPANGGTETPYKTRGGITVLYMFNLLTGKHAWYDVDHDVFLTTEEGLRLHEPEAYK